MSADPKPIRFLYLGRISFEQARELQELWVKQCSGGAINEMVLLCEHPPILSLGKRSKPEEMGLSRQDWEIRGVEVVNADRGGAVTYHGPGQLVVYPVMSLRARRIGVKAFVETGLQAIAEVVRLQGIDARVTLDPVGIWVGDAKIAAAGLRFQRGVSNHGFALNVSCDLEPFSLFTPCGEDGIKTTPIAEQIPAKKVRVEDVAVEVSRAFERHFQ